MQKQKVNKASCVGVHLESQHLGDWEDHYKSEVYLGYTVRAYIKKPNQPTNQQNHRNSMLACYSRSHKKPPGVIKNMWKII